MILLICKDLMFVSQVQNVCRRMNQPIATVSTVEKAIESIETPTEDAISQVFLDLKTNASPAALQELASKTEQGQARIAVTAFGPHVKVEMLQAAKDAGFERVWTQGQFHKNFPALIS